MRRYDDEPMVSLEAQGRDAREVFAELFAQARKSFVVNVAVERKVYLILKEVPFFKALKLLCEATQTRFVVRDGVYYIEPLGARPTPSESPAVERRRVRLVGSAMPLRAVAAGLEKQAGVKVEVAPEVPDLYLSLNLPQGEVESVLEAVCQGAGLRWELTAQGYRIQVAEPPKVSAPSARPPVSGGTLRTVPPSPRTVPSRPAPPERPLQCPKCRYALQLEWRYCPICGAFVKPLTDRAKRKWNTP